MPTREFGANATSCDHHEITRPDEVTTFAGAAGVGASAPSGKVAVTDTRLVHAQDAIEGPGDTAVCEA